MSKLILNLDKSSSSSEPDDDKDLEHDDKYLMITLKKIINRMIKSSNPVDKRFIDLYHVRKFKHVRARTEKTNNVFSVKNDLKLFESYQFVRPFDIYQG